MRTLIAIIAVVGVLCGLAVYFVLHGAVDSAQNAATKDSAAAAPTVEPGAGTPTSRPDRVEPKVTRGRDEAGEAAADVVLLSIAGIVRVDAGSAEGAPLAGALISAYAVPLEDAHDGPFAGFEDLLDEDEIEEWKELAEEMKADGDVLAAEGEDEDGDGKADSGTGATIRINVGRGSSTAKASKKGIEAMRKAGGFSKLIDGALDQLGSAAIDAEMELKATTTSGTDGAFRIDGLPAGLYELRATAPGHVRAKTTVAAGVEDAQLKLPIGTTLNGVVLCEGAGVADVEVFSDGSKTTTDGAGRFTFDGLRMPKAWLLLTRTGYVAKVHAVERDADGDNPEERVLIDPAGQIAGHATDASGKPLQGVKVTLGGGGLGDVMSMAMRMAGGGSASDLTAPKVPEPSATTDATGAYLLDGVPGGEVVVQADHTGFLSGRNKQVVVEPRRTTDGVDFAMIPEAVFVGQVTGPDGKPVGSASIEVKVPSDEGGFGAMMSQMFGGSSESDTADAEGNFRVAGLPAGELQVTVSGVGYLKARDSITLASGQETRKDFGLQEGFKVGGRVLTPDGKPLAEASVEVEWPRPKGEGNPMLDMWLGGETVDVETDDEGNFVAPGLQEGPYTITADHDEYLEVKLEDVAAGTLDLEISLGLAATLRGIVISETDGTPMAGVRVTAEGGKRPSSGNPMLAMFGGAGETAETDANGAFELTGLYPGKYRVWGRKRGFADSDRVKLELVAGDVVEDVTVGMPPGESLGGRVVDTSGSPVVDALVFVSRSKNPWMNNAADMGIGDGARINAPPESVYAYSRSDGTYELTGLTPGKLTVEVRSRTHAPLTKRGVPVPGGDLDLALSSGGSVAGIVYGENGKPKVGAQVMLMKGMGVGQRFTTTGGDGRYVIENLAPGSYMMMLMNLGGEGGGMNFGDMKFESVTVRDGETTTQDFSEAATGKPLEGVVIQNGEPLVNAMVVLTGNNGGTSMKMEQTGDDGRFAFKGVAPGEYTLMVQRNMMGGAATSRKVTVGEDGEVEDVRLEFSSLSLAGKVVDAETGDPVASAQIVVSDRGGRGSMTSLNDAIEQTKGQGFTGTDGTFDLDGMPEGSFTVRVTAAGYAGTYVDDVRPGTPVTISISKGLELAVTVVDTDGNAITGASVQAEDAEGRESLAFDISFQGQTDNDGIARIRMNPGSYTLHVQANGFPAESVRVTAAQGAVTVKLRAGGTLELEIVDGDGKPVAGIAAVVKDKDGNAIQRRLTMGNAFGSGMLSDAQGRINRESLPAGTVTVTVTDPKDVSRSATAEAKITSGGTTRLKLTLQ